MSSNEVDVARDADFAANGSTDLLMEIWGEIASDPTIKDDAKDTKEVKDIKKKRRSTLVASKSWREIDVGKIDLEDD